MNQFPARRFELLAATLIAACVGCGSSDSAGSAIPDVGADASSDGAADTGFGRPDSFGTDSGGGCTGSPCGGDPVGTWKLVTFCGPSCVSSVADTISFDADGTYHSGGSTGTWTVSGTSVTTTVSGASSTASFCVSGDSYWSNRTTNCGTASGPLTVRRTRVSGTPLPDSGR